MSIQESKISSMNIPVNSGGYGDIMRNHRSTGKSATGDDYGNLLDTRMATLGLDPDAIENCDGKAYDHHKQRCRTCGHRQACAADMTRDPYNPVWETYCPNSKTLISLTEAWWQKIGLGPPEDGG